eukprot:scaffold8845_cov225-Skeletonema_marinoi.AAC.2
MASHRTGDLCNRDLNVFTRAMYYGANPSFGEVRAAVFFELKGRGSLRRDSLRKLLWSHGHLSKNSKLYSIDHLIIFQRAIFGLKSEMKSRKEINKQNYQRKRDYIKAQRKLYYSPAQRKLQHDATYSPAQRKLAYIQQKSASAQKVRNEQFCNRSTRSTSTSTSNQADIARASN